MVSHIGNSHCVAFAKVAVVISLLSGCSTMSYTPNVSLERSEKTIEARIQFDGYVDKTPATDHENRIFGFSATHEDSLTGHLATDVSDAVLNDFQDNYVFSDVGKEIQEPDYIISGTINRFSGTTGIVWYMIPLDIFWLLGIPCCTEEGEIEMTTNVKTPNGEIIASVTSSSNFGNWYTIYNKKTLSLPSKMNKSLREVVLHIRQHLLSNLGKQHSVTQASNEDIREEPASIVDGFMLE